MRFLRLLERAPRVIERLLGHLVRRQVILFTVVRGRYPVSVSRHLVHFSRYSMRIAWHISPSTSLHFQQFNVCAISGYNHQTGHRRAVTMEEQSYKKHAQFVPMFHFVLLGLIAIAIVGSLVNLYNHIGDARGRTAVVLLAIISFSLILLFGFTRTFSMKVQDRAIRAEENLRHFALTGKLLDHRLKIKQIVALRFASDAEFVDLARKAADEGLSMDAIKQSIKHWRPDYDRA
jgi:hypothetical protein